MVRLSVTRELTLPDPIRLERFKRSPALGPKILFFSGGTALRNVSRHLTIYTHNSIHIITPFDSGGSSATLRKAFHMLAVGDVRNRLMALADHTIQGNPEIFELFAYRLPKDDADITRQSLCNELSALALGKHPLIKSIPDPMRKIIRNHFHVFVEKMPDDFDLRGASLGNIVLTAGYLSNRNHIDPVIYLFSKLVEVRGVVRPVVNQDAQLAVQLENGDILVGQHTFTGKESKPISAPICAMWLASKQSSPEPVTIPIRNKTRMLIKDADLICYPMGSFYSSIIANLLPEGVGATVASVNKPKVFIPNTGTDPELTGHDLQQQVDTLLHYLRKDDPERIKDEHVLDFVLIDSKNGQYNGTLNAEALTERGIRIIDCPLISERSAPYIDEELLTPILLSLS